MKIFIPGLKLSELFYSEAAKPILDTFFPQLSYSAALLGWGSEVLGFDDVRSSDHHWGPRFFLFLSAEDHKQYKNAIYETLRDNLPHRFRGYSTSFGEPDEVGVRHLSDTDSGPVNHMIHIETIKGFFGWYLGCNPYEAITAVDWLSFSEHKLLAVTSGKVFHDGLGELEEIRRKFDYYPRDVWLYQIAAQWIKIFEDREFVSRSGDVGDELGHCLASGIQTDAALFSDGAEVCAVHQVVWNWILKTGMCFRIGTDLQGRALVVDVERAGRKPREGFPRNRADAQCLEHHTADRRRRQQLLWTTIPHL